MAFEIIFITEGPESTPAAEIQFNRQRLCIVRSTANMPQIEFVQDLYVGREVKMAFPLRELQETVQLAADDLAAWLRNLADGRAEA